MNLGERIKKAINLSKTNAPDVARASGVAIASINALMRRSSKRSEFTEQIIRELDPQKVNIDWVRTGNGISDPKGSPSISCVEVEQEVKLLMLFKKLSLPQQQAVIDVVQSCLALARDAGRGQTRA